MTHALDTLWETIEDRKGGDPEQSYTAKLLARGIGRVAQKLGEEAVEAAIEAARLEAGTGSTSALAGESADLLYHLFVLWSAAGMTPGDVYAVLEQRQGLSGIAEKKSRDSAIS
jgi:phosphoribosyl-ATP pyrophosphohydrolase